MAVWQLSINSEFNAQSLSCAKFFLTPTNEVIYRRSDHEYLCWYLFFLLASNEKQKNGVEGEGSSSTEGLSLQLLLLGGDSYLGCLIAKYPCCK